MTLSTPFKSNSIKIMTLGSGELAKELIIEASRLGLESIAVDSYANAPAFLVANHNVVIDMKNQEQLLETIRAYRPDYIIPEIEAINIDAIFMAQDEGFCIMPNANTIDITMNRKHIRQLASDELKLKCSKYEFVKTKEELYKACEIIKFPCVVKPIMSSSGYGQSIVKNKEDIEKAFKNAKNARGDSSELIVEEFIDFDYEITLLTVRNDKDTLFCKPIGHIQKNGDYIYSWQPAKMSKKALLNAKKIALSITENLGGRGVFGVELFVKKDEVYFSEISPRPHDTGMVTLITQSQSQFALHIRGILSLPLEYIDYGCGASGAFKSKKESFTPAITIDKEEIFCKNSFIRVFAKPKSYLGRRMAVVLYFHQKSAKKALKKVKKLMKYVRDS